MTVLLVGVALLATSLAALAAPPAGRDGNASARTHPDGPWANLSESARGHGLAAAESHRLFAKLAYANGTATGRFVSFGLDNATGVITHYDVVSNNATIPVFASITPTPFNATDDVRVTGSVLRLEGDNATLMVHNNPLALLNWRAEDAGLNLTFALAPNVTITNDTTNQTVKLNLATSHGHLTIAGNGTFTSVSNGTIKVALDPHASLLFAYHTTESKLMASGLHAAIAAAAHGHVGAVVSAVDADGSPLDDATDLGVSAHATSLSHGHATIRVSSDTPEGRSVLVQLGNDTIPANATVVVTLDNETLPNATLDDALSGARAGVNVTRTDEGVSIAVSVPHFSDHDITVSAASTGAGTGTTTPTSATDAGATTPASSTPAAPSKATPGFEAAALLGALALGLLVLRRRG
ncbi:MAG: hypothetical protein QOE90_1435 [Thermoplasmata archaeon]|jgi:hypothetical protein|nr:hypothetical protein [Thermoplasmata archaeon]